MFKVAPTTLRPAVIVKLVVPGVPWPRSKPAVPVLPEPLRDTEQNGAALKPAEKVTVAIVPVVAVPPIKVISPRVLVHV